MDQEQLAGPHAAFSAPSQRAAYPHRGEAQPPLAHRAILVGPRDTTGQLERLLAAASYAVRIEPAPALDSDTDLLVLCCSGTVNFGPTIARQRKAGHRQPILVLGHDAPCPHCDSALEGGADAWIPLFMIELQLLRSVRTLTRRFHDDWRPDPRSPIELHADTHEVDLGTGRVNLTPKAFELLSYLVCHEGTWVKTDNILRDVFGVRFKYDTPLVRVHIRLLRQALGQAAHHVQSRRGQGYRFANTRPTPIIR